MSIQPIAMHQATHNTPQAVTKSSTHNHEHDYVSCSYDSLESFKDHLTYAIMQQSTIFAALQLVKEINKANGYKVFTVHEKKLFHKHLSKNKNQKEQNLNNKIAIRQRELENQSWESVKESFNTDQSGKNKKHSRNKAADKYKQLQKGYMSLLSVCGQ